jgi:hypothetical protein
VTWTFNEMKMRPIYLAQLRPFQIVFVLRPQDEGWTARFDHETIRLSKVEKRFLTISQAFSEKNETA